MVQTLLQQLQHNQAQFADVIAFIDERYTHTATAFQNGIQHNAADQNQGSAKIFAFAQRHQLSAEQTLMLFAEHYHAVLAHPDANDHQNIRQFIKNGWQGIQFEGNALSEK